ncbi:hypothetical protein KUG47_13070 [Falsochrobactrum sp. TDYN1]|uniref:Twin-arginine translocation signal domain-containing protein n=1 Tax=Falsochrobactrum tianjinense TaxID=2706015 RepID=A0A949PN54_9HYPH|nr:twin-arginine translocation signal domain-containing protein [Falsochrobactrum sp. TDYN1]MBV2144426.1 hypothetical protein [Falsochrobactrum sp. TDYN1]
MLNRRSFLRAAPAAGVALTVPAVAIAAKPEKNPDERIDAALAEIIAAFREKWPNCPIRIDDIDNVSSGVITIISHCGKDEPGTVNFRRRKLSTVKPKVHFDDGSPLLADDVTGSTAFADWERRKST